MNTGDTAFMLIATALVFFMTPGLAFFYGGLVRRKNVCNTMMACVAIMGLSVVLWTRFGYSLAFGGNHGGIIGDFRWIALNGVGWEAGPYADTIPHLVFCAFQMMFAMITPALITGSLVGRMKFKALFLFVTLWSFVVYYPLAHMVWGEGGLLAAIGSVDFAGGDVVHISSGISALVLAIILGRRRGYEQVTYRIHNIPFVVLGASLLWFGWFGFNGAAATTIEDLGSIFLTTTVAPAIATVTCMIFTWIRYGKPDVSMCLNASLAGLVGITAPCDVTDAFGATMIGIVSGLLVVFGVWLLDYKLHVDDPVGAVAVHMMNGIWGTIAVGLFATSSAPGYAIALEGGTIKGEGLFYGGGFTQLGLQLLGFVSVAAWAAVCMVIVFTVIKATIGLRASKEEEIRGLDIMEHGLSSAYAGFEFGGMDFVDGDVDVIGSESMETSVPALVKTSDAGDGKKITKVEILMKQERFERFKKAMNDIGVTGMTVTQVLGCGTQKGAPEYYRGVPMDIQLLPKTQVEMVISSVPVMDVINATRKALYTGHIGDGKIFVYDVEDVVKVRTGESGYDALQGEDD